MIFSRTLDMGESSDIGRKGVPEHGSLFGFGMGILFASFQICGMTFPHGMFMAIFSACFF